MNENQIVVAAVVTRDANDVLQYQPMVAATRATLDAAGISALIGWVLADAGYWSDDNANVEGPDKLIATLKDHKQRWAARDLGTTTGPPPDDASTLDAMEHRLRTARAQPATRNAHTRWNPLGDHKENRGYRRFRRRGLPAVCRANGPSSTSATISASSSVITPESASLSPDSDAQRAGTRAHLPRPPHSLPRSSHPWSGAAPTVT